jgi:hypothetical protein
VVGIHFPADVATGFLWRAGAVTNLDGCLVQSGVDPRINAMGQVLCEISETGGAITGFWRDGTVTPVPGADGSFRGVALNDSGDVAGGTRFLSRGQMTEIAEKPHMLIPLATELNNRRQVLMKGGDVSTYFSGAEGAYLWNASDGSTSAVMSNGRYGRFGRMNDSGVVVGTFHQQGVEFSGMSSFDINNAGDIVGSDSGRAFVAIGGAKYILDAVVDADAELVSATVINESGQILVQGNVRSSGKATWFLLSPRQVSAMVLKR